MATPSQTSLDPWLGLLLGLLLVALNGFFVAAEFALAKVRPTQIAPQVKRGDRRARVAAQMVRHLDAYLSATQLGITLASIALGWVGEPAFAWLLEPVISRVPGATPALLHSISLTLAFATVSVLHIVFGELVPKSMAIRHPGSTTLWTALPLYAFYWIAYPAIWLLNRTANGILRLIGFRPANEHELGHTEEEMRLLLASRAGGAQLTDDKRDLLANVFELFDRVARQVMIPRGDVVYLRTSDTPEGSLELARSSGHTRLPLCERDLESIVGIVHIKDLFRSEGLPADLREIARPIRFVPETTPLDKLLARMRAERLHMAAVLDEFGGVSGIVTLENVIEEIVGPIQDEFDTERPDLVAKGDGVYQLSGSMLVLDLEHELGLEISDRDQDTVAGLVLSRLGRRPRMGDRAEIAGLAFEVVEVQGNRIRTLRLTAPAPAPGAP
jgi:CBS domain containing-hemolysin-like protein